MNTNEQAKSSFKTFVVTFSVALALIVAVYFVATDYSTDTDIEDELASSEELPSTIVVEEKSTVMGYASESQEDVSVFEELAAGKMENNDPAVLQAATGGTDVDFDDVTDDPVTDTETPESTSPDIDPGTTEATLALIISTIVLGFGVYIWLKSPRKLALSSFENKVNKKL